MVTVMIAAVAVAAVVTITIDVPVYQEEQEQHKKMKKVIKTMMKSGNIMIFYQEQIQEEENVNAED